MSILCEAGCGRRFGTIRSMNTHLTSDTRKCKRYVEGKLKDLGMDDYASLSTQLHQAYEEEVQAQEEETWEMDYQPMDFDTINPGIDEFHFLPTEAAPGGDPADDGPSNNQNAVAGPGPSTAAHAILRQAKAAASQVQLFDDRQDSRRIFWSESAGHILRYESRPLYNPATSVPDQQGDIQMAECDQVFHPFSSELDWMVAQWAIKDGPGQNALDRLLEIPGVVERLGLSFHNTRGLHQKVDSIPERAGDWQTRYLSFQDEPNERYAIRFRDPVEAIKSLWKDPELSPTMVYAPGKHYTDKTKKSRIFSEMWSAKWWHVCQSKLPKGATVAPVIIATDKTQLTQFSGNKSAYPIYLTIGNIPKAIRRKPSKKACILIGYLSVEKIDRKQMTERMYRAKVQRLFHESMKIILESLRKAGEEGVEMTSADGAVRLVFPILSCYIADYPEQCLVSCSKYGTCVKCRCKATELGESNPKEARTQSWTQSILLEAQATSGQNSRAFYDYCMAHEVAGTVPKPFWTDFPLCDINRAITPDVLHQLHQGILKHLIAWCQKILTPEQLDLRIRCLPHAYGLRRFKNGISALAQITGSERKNIAKILLGCLVGAIPVQGVAAITALLDFIYIAQYTSHSTDTLVFLEDALKRFQDNRDYFINTGVRDDFNIPKFHSLLHYVEAIKLFGTTDNYNTETFERLHIDFAKLGWRASNQRDEFPQMIRWLSRQEKIAAYEAYQRALQIQSTEQGPRKSHPSRTTTPISLPKSPNFPGKTISSIQEQHDAPDFGFYLKQYLNRFMTKPLGPRQHQRLDLTPLSFDKVDVYNMFRFQPEELQDDEEEKDIVKAIARSPKLPHGRFDPVVVVVDGNAESTGLAGTRIGRVKVIFTLPKVLNTFLGPRPLPENWPQGPLAFVEWYSPLSKAAEERHGMMYRIKRPAVNAQNRRPGAVISIGNIRQSCMLFPVFPRDNVPGDWNSENVLDLSNAFLVNNWQSKYSYQTIY